MQVLDKTTAVEYLTPIELVSKPEKSIGRKGLVAMLLCKIAAYPRSLDSGRFV